MKMDRKLNLVIPVIRDSDGVTVYVHATPISRQVFETYAVELARTHTRIFAGGLGIAGGPRIAATLLRRAAAEEGTLDGPAGVNQGLLPEIRRLANVVRPTGNGWGMLPYEDAVRAKEISEDDAAEVENSLVFFTVVSRMFGKDEGPALMESAASLWGAQTTSFNCTAFLASLPTSTQADAMKAEAMPAQPLKASQVPY